MKITREQLQALQEREASRPGQIRKAGNFEELLSKELASDTAGAVKSADLSQAAPLPGLLAARASVTAGVAQTGENTLEEAASQMDAMFGVLEQFAQELARNEQADLKQADVLLSDVGARIHRFKEQYPQLGAQLPALADMLNDVDVLTTTERFKFNRGDYL